MQAIRNLSCSSVPAETILKYDKIGSNIVERTNEESSEDFIKVTECNVKAKSGEWQYILKLRKG